MEKKDQEVSAGPVPRLQAGLLMGVPPDGRLPESLPTCWPYLGHKGLTTCSNGTVRQYKRLKET